MKTNQPFQIALASISLLASVPVLANQTPPKNRVSMNQARHAATQAYAGKIKGQELEFEGGKWIYSFDLKGPHDKNVHEVHVDAISGKVIDVHTETAADESREAKEDANQK